MEQLLIKTLSLEEVTSILQVIFPYDVTPVVLTSFHVKTRGREVNVAFLFDFLEVETRGDPERDTVFGRLVGELTGRRIGDFEQLTSLSYHVLAHS